ncbi:cuticle protein 19-like [Frankliniella occidentalis]|uniref:Cuticle protein 19-like n=1 Tax=Frankliniella occidentalis TaxID=133901 RepID=A0A6J1S7C8_FRAOC|nr:cuticle protein 19-like [Frankliniella occidentalis]
MDIARVLVLLLLAGASLAQGPVIIEPVIVSDLPASSGSASADLHFDPALDHAASRPEYAFAYGVKDPQSGNAQSHKEQRDGDNVRGEYKVLEADGSVRTVTYTVDPKNGFQANVHQSDPSLSAAFKSEAKQSSKLSVPDASSVDIPVGSEPSEYFSGSSYHTDFDP